METIEEGMLVLLATLDEDDDVQGEYDIGSTCSSSVTPWFRREGRWMENRSGTDGPVLSLESVVLPAADGEPPASRSFIGRAVVAVVVMVGFDLLLNPRYIVLTIVLLYLAVANGAMVAALIIPVLILALVVSNALFSTRRPPGQPPDELLVPREEEPGLYATVEELARRVGTESPHQIVMIPQASAYVRGFRPFLGTRRKRTLAIGAPLLDVLDISGLRCVLAHELGHYISEDTKSGAIVFRYKQHLSLVSKSAPGRITEPVLLAYARLYLRVCSAANRNQELVADRVSVKIGGRQVVADALWAGEVAARGEDAFVQEYLLPLLKSGALPRDLAAGLRGLLSNADRIDELVNVDQSEDDVDPWAAHPPTPVRIARVAAIADERPITRDGRAARTLLGDPDRWIDAVNNQWLERLTDDTIPTDTITWDAWPDRVMPMQTADVGEALAELGLPSTLDGLQTAIDGGRDGTLVAELAERGWRGLTDGGWHGASERDVLVHAITAVAGQHAIDHVGARWSLSWSDRVELYLADGRPVRLRELSERALDGDWRELRTTTGASATS